MTALQIFLIYYLVAAIVFSVVGYKAISPGSILFGAVLGIFGPLIWPFVFLFTGLAFLFRLIRNLLNK